MTRWNPCCCVISNRIGFLILERKRLGTEPVFSTPTLNYYIREFKGVQGWTSGYTGDYRLNQLQWGPTKVLGVHKGDTLQHLGSADYCSIPEGVQGLSFDHQLKATLLLPSVYAGVTVDNKILNPRTYFDHGKHPFIDMSRCIHGDSPSKLVTNKNNYLWSKLILGEDASSGGVNSYLIPYLWYDAPDCCGLTAARLYNVINSDPEKESYALDVQYSSAIPSPKSNLSYQIFFTVGKQEGEVKTIQEVPVKSGAITTPPWLDRSTLNTSTNTAWNYYCKGFTAVYPCPLTIGYCASSYSYITRRTFTTISGYYKGSIIKNATYQFLPHPIEVYAVTLKECIDPFTGQKKIEIFDGQLINTNQLQYLWPSEQKEYCTDCYYDPQKIVYGSTCSGSGIPCLQDGVTTNGYWMIDNYYGYDGLFGDTGPCKFENQFIGPPIYDTRFFGDVIDYSTSKIDNTDYTFNDPDLGFKYKCFREVGSGTTTDNNITDFVCCKAREVFTIEYVCPEGNDSYFFAEESNVLTNSYGGNCPPNTFFSSTTDFSCNDSITGTRTTTNSITYTPVGGCNPCSDLVTTLCIEEYQIINGIKTCLLSGGQCIICTNGNPCGCNDGGPITVCNTTGLPGTGLIPFIEDQTAYDYNKYLFYGVSGGTTLPEFDEYLVNILNDYNTNRGYGNTYAIPYDYFTYTDGKKIRDNYTDIFTYQIKKQLNYNGVSLSFNYLSDANTWFIFNPTNLVSYTPNYYKTFSQANELFRDLEKTYLFQEYGFTANYNSVSNQFIGSNDFNKIKFGAPGAPAATGLTYTNLSCDAYIDILQSQGWACSGSGTLKTCTKGITGITFICAPTCWDNIKSAFGYTFSGSEIKPDNRSIGSTYSWGWTAGFVRTSVVGATSSVLDYVSTLDYLNGLTYPCVLNQPYSYGFFRTMRDIYGVTF